MKNKKGKSDSGPVGFVLAIALGIIILVFLTGGGLSTLFNITKTIKSIPTFIWVILGIIILFKVIGGKK